MHKFLIHKQGDHVGVATSDIEAGEKVIGVYMDDDSTIEAVAAGAIPLGHKIAVADLAKDGHVIEYGLPIGYAPEGFKFGDYVHTHNIKTLRW
ncbi:UxaA family hydrolase [Paenibacillus pasadenensis]|uniref:UxaA family hydrolase n=1 Tax=Paenibacillus pasadenensis TaxID=217090 RepID=UPI002041E79C|nr:UxaA family hydrolase [Paenibacillus pasadenensis]MCM3748767.1 UxaA family hydrolase [Paenibacillus pasadenensis]